MLDVLYELWQLVRWIPLLLLSLSDIFTPNKWQYYLLKHSAVLFARLTSTCKSTDIPQNTCFVDVTNNLQMHLSNT